ncbi:MAG TPA: ABC transporter permease [Clostridiales bacterium]|nr:MAG: Chromosome partition protein Smc [Firmicutes bacterium ADurb.Bin262]HOU09514.1 ABC transporter permease [Clostridiales bacterium]
MSKALFREFLRSIRRTIKRYLAIIAITGLGISVFTGVRATGPDMEATADRYFNDNNLMDIRVVSTIGLAGEDIDTILAVDSVEAVMPSKFVDTFVEKDGAEAVGVEGAALVCRAMSLDFGLAREASAGADDSAYMNRLHLTEGRYPDKPGECVLDSSEINSTTTFEIGDKIKLKGDGENLGSILTTDVFTIVGKVETPLFVSYERGTTLAGGGKLGSFIYIPEGAFKTDYYSEVYVTVKGADAFGTFTREYTEHIKGAADRIQAVSADAVSRRAVLLAAEYTPKIEQGEKDYAAKKAEVDAALAKAQEKVDQIIYYAKNGEAELAKKTAEGQAMLDAARAKLDAAKEEYNTGLARYNEGIVQYNEGKAKADAGRPQYEAAVAQLNEAAQDISDAQERINRQQALVDSAENFVNSADEATLATLIANLSAAGYETSFLESLPLSEVKAVISASLVQYRRVLSNAQEKLAAGIAEYEANKKKVDAATAEYERLDAAKAELENAKERLSQAKIDIALGEAQFQVKQAEFEFKIKDAQRDLNLAVANADTAQAEFDKKKAEALAGLAAARLDLDNGKKLLASLDTASWYVLKRSDLPGNADYSIAVENMDAISGVFPVFFFFIAAAVCLTTMTRMVEEERLQLGTLKALGYTSRAIVSKYIFYALSATAFGAAEGLILGFRLFPRAIFDVYSIIFNMPPILLPFRIGDAVLGTLLISATVAAAAFLACRKELLTHPAQLMRVKSPKPGRKVWLERIGFVWNRMSFTSKVTVRNLFRDKKRMAVTVFGIAGCTALLLSAFGLNDSVGGVVEKQFGAGGVSLFDGQIALSQPIDAGIENSEVLGLLKSDVRIKQTLPVFYQSLDAGSASEGSERMNAGIVVPADTSTVSAFMRLENRKTGEKYQLGDDGVLVTEKFAAKTSVAPGGEIAVDTPAGTVKLKVAGIVENYTFHYIYISSALYEKAFGAPPRYNLVMANLADSMNAGSAADRKKAAADLSRDLMNMDGIMAVTLTDQLIESFGNITGSLNDVVFIFILAAGALAFVVLYNLNNININERKRELATIKVLGFYDREVSSYIYRENVFLTLLGIAIGIAAGIFLHRYMVAVAEVNIVMFGREIKPLSYALACAITLFFALIVNLLMHRSLKKLSMVESLKVSE